MSIKETLEWFIGIYNLNSVADQERDAFYCGITSDIQEQRKKHNVTQFLGVTKCDNSQTAKKLKDKMHEAGFDTSFNPEDANQNSIYCYLYKKVAGVTNEP